MRICNQFGKICYVVVDGLIVDVQDAPGSFMKYFPENKALSFCGSVVVVLCLSMFWFDGVTEDSLFLKGI